MNNTTLIRQTIKALLKKHGLNYRDLATELSVTEGTVKQLMTKGSFTVERIEQIASVFTLSFAELMSIAVETKLSPTKISIEQEEILLSFPLSIRLLFLLGTGFSISVAQEKFGGTEKNFQKAIHILDRAQLIELLPMGRVRLKARAPYRFNKTGAIERQLRRDYLRIVADQFLETPNSSALQRTFEMYVSQKMLKQIQGDIESLIEKYAHRARLEAELHSPEDIFPITAAFMVKPFDGWGKLLSR